MIVVTAITVGAACLAFLAGLGFGWVAAGVWPQDEGQPCTRCGRPAHREWAGWANHGPVCLTCSHPREPRP